MVEIIAQSLVHAVKQTCDLLLTDDDNQPVGHVTRDTGAWNLQKQTRTLMTETHGLHIIITQPMRRWHSLVNRGLVTETLDLMLGDNPGFIQDVWPFYRQWQTRGDAYEYTYGARLQGVGESVNQWNQAVQTLREHPSSRQAFLVIRRPEDIIEKYQPCSIGCHFQIAENGTLDMHWLMRSNDVTVGGLARNLFMNLHLFEQMCLATGIPMGTYFHYSTNTHFYEPDYVKIETLSNELTEPTDAEPHDLVQSRLFTPQQKSFTREILTQALRANDFGNIRQGRNLISKLDDNPYYQNLVRFVISLDEDIKLNELLWLQQFTK